MTGTPQPLQSTIPIVDGKGCPTSYFIRWAQQRQIDIQNSVPQSRQVLTSTGLTGGGALSNDLTLVLADTAVSPGTFGDATHVARITVDQQGRLTAAEPIEITTIPEAPQDGKYYCRQNGAWVAFTPQSVP